MAGGLERSQNNVPIFIISNVLKDLNVTFSKPSTSSSTSTKIDQRYRLTTSWESDSIDRTVHYLPITPPSKSKFCEPEIPGETNTYTAAIAACLMLSRQEGDSVQLQKIRELLTNCALEQARQQARKQQEEADKKQEEADKKQMIEDIHKYINNIHRIVLGLTDPKDKKQAQMSDFSQTASEHAKSVTANTNIQTQKLSSDKTETMKFATESSRISRRDGRSYNDSVVYYSFDDLCLLQSPGAPRCLGNSIFGTTGREEGQGLYQYGRTFAESTRQVYTKVPSKGQSINLPISAPKTRCPSEGNAFTAATVTAELVNRQTDTTKTLDELGQGLKKLLATMKVSMPVSDTDSVEELQTIRYALQRLDADAQIVCATRTT